MKFTVIQPRYSQKREEGDACFAEMLAQLDACDATSDVIVLPEYCDVPYYEPDNEKFFAVAAANREPLIRKVRETAIRCGAVIFCNYFEPCEGGLRNTTFAYDRNGDCVGKYYKTHPAPSEVRKAGIDVSYSYRADAPTILEIDGVRYAFLTCYDFYFYEYFARVARENPDVIIGCSHQRTDRHDTLDTIGQFLSYNTNAYLVRASVSLGADSAFGGSSMIVAPDGKILVDMENLVGAASAEFDPHARFRKPAGYHGVEKMHHEYIEDGRRPWLYRPAGSMMIRNDRSLPYPRVCAHRGFNTVAPENSLPAFGAAVALGADEIEFDIWSTTDGQLVSVHDSSLERVSDGHGKVFEHSYEELKQLDFGSSRGPQFAGLGIVTFEEILKKFACTCIMNIHVKIWGREYLDPRYEQIISLIRKYDCADHVYMMSHDSRSLEEFHKLAPDIARCKGYGHDPNYVDEAIRLGCEKVQLFKPYFDQEMIDRAHAAGVKCNVFWSDDPDEARKFLNMGIDCILTNDYLRVSQSVADIIGARE